MQISTSGLNTLKNREQLRLTAYADSRGIWTIGWGCTYYESGAEVKKGDTITQARAVQLLNFHIGVAASGVNRNVKSGVNQNQFDALLSFVYNVGEPRFKTSSVLREVNKNPNDYQAVAAAFRLWNKETRNGVLVFSQGLYNRREEEIKMYTGGSAVISQKKKAGSSSL